MGCVQDSGRRQKSGEVIAIAVLPASIPMHWGANAGRAVFGAGGRRLSVVFVRALMRCPRARRLV